MCARYVPSLIDFHYCLFEKENVLRTTMNQPFKSTFWGTGGGGRNGAI